MSFASSLILNWVFVFSHLKALWSVFKVKRHLGVSLALPVPVTRNRPRVQDLTLDSEIRDCAEGGWHHSTVETRHCALYLAYGSLSPDIPNLKIFFFKTCKVGDNFCLFLKYEVTPQTSVQFVSSRHR